MIGKVPHPLTLALVPLQTAMISTARHPRNSGFLRKTDPESVCEDFDNMLRPTDLPVVRLNDHSEWLAGIAENSLQMEASELQDLRSAVRTEQCILRCPGLTEGMSTL